MDRARPLPMEHPRRARVRPQPKARAPATICGIALGTEMQPTSGDWPIARESPVCSRVSTRAALGWGGRLRRTTPSPPPLSSRSLLPTTRRPRIDGWGRSWVRSSPPKVHRSSWPSPPSRGVRCFSARPSIRPASARAPRPYSFLPAERTSPTSCEPPPFPRFGFWPSGTRSIPPRFRRTSTRSDTLPRR
jgi:hypothetical protein